MKLCIDCACGAFKANHTEFEGKAVDLCGLGLVAKQAMDLPSSDEDLSLCPKFPLGFIRVL